VDKRDGWYITENKKSIIDLLKTAGVSDTEIPHVEPVGLGQIYKGSISVFNNITLLREDVVLTVHGFLTQAKGTFKQRIYDSFNPIFWTDDLSSTRGRTTKRRRAMKSTISLSVGLLVVAAVSQVHARNCFGTSAMTCNPWQQSVQADAYLQTGGRAKHKNPATGLIQVFCPVFNTFTPFDQFSSDTELTWNDLYVTYKDPDGQGEQYQVTAALRYVDTAGQVRTIASVDSNKQLSGVTSDTTMQTRIEGHDFNFVSRHYYVQIGIYRSDTALEPDVAGFNICGRLF
jgi:hypothetical protein